MLPRTRGIGGRRSAQSSAYAARNIASAASHTPVRLGVPRLGGTSWYQPPRMGSHLSADSTYGRSCVPPGAGVAGVHAIEVDGAGARLGRWDGERADDGGAANLIERLLQALREVGVPMTAALRLLAMVGMSFALQPPGRPSPTRTSAALRPGLAVRCSFRWVSTPRTLADPFSI